MGKVTSMVVAAKDNSGWHVLISVLRASCLFSPESCCACCVLEVL